MHLALIKKEQALAHAQFINLKTVPKLSYLTGYEFKNGN